MVRAYHVIFGMYGFWLPNDERGSWSDFVGSWELLGSVKQQPSVSGDHWPAGPSIP